MIKVHEGCPICHSRVVYYSGDTDDCKACCNCENGHFWLEHTEQEIIGGQTNEKIEIIDTTN